VYGGWKGSQFFEKSGLFPGSSEWRRDLGYGAHHSFTTCRNDTYIYIIKGKNPSGEGVLYRMPADGTATAESIVSVATAPFKVGRGCSIAYVPASLSFYGREELWILRGGAGAGLSGDGVGGQFTEDAWVYDIGDGIWSQVQLPYGYGEGCNLIVAGDTLFLSSDVDIEGGLTAAIMLPEPGLYGILAAMALSLGAVRRRRQ